MATNDPWRSQLVALGGFIRAQRRLADLSLREMADVAKISNAYLSQVERGLHQPSVRVLRSIAAALNVPADELLIQAGLMTPTRDGAGGTPSAEGEAPAQPPAAGVEAAILADPALSDDERKALLAVYRSFVPPRR